MNSKSHSFARLRIGLRHLGSTLLLIAALVIILAAVVVGVGRVLIPHADQARPWLEAELAGRVGHEVTIGRIEAEWPRLTPRLTLSSIRVGDPGDPLVTIDEAQLVVHLDDLVSRERSMMGLIVLGLDLVVSEDEAGHWGLRLEGGGQLDMSNAPVQQRALAGQLTIRDANVRVVPHGLPASVWQLVEADVQRSPDQTLLSGRLHPLWDADSSMRLMLKAGHTVSELEELEAWFEVSDFAIRGSLLTELLPADVATAGRRLNATAWLDWRRHSVARLDARLSVSGGTRQPVRARLAVERRGDRTNAELTDLAIGDEVAIDSLLLAHQGRHWAASAGRMDLAALHEILTPWSVLSPWWPEQVDGRIHNLRAHFESGAGLHRLEGSVDGLSLAATEPVPGIRGLDLEVGLSGDRVVLRPSGAVTLDWPWMFRQPLIMESVGGEAVVSPGGIELNSIYLSHAVVDARADGWIYLGGSRPFMDLGIEVERGEAGDPRPWLPHGIIREKALSWMDQALVRVDSARGGLLFHFRAGHRATDFSPGDFQAWIEFAGADMDYWPGWPVARLESGRVEFEGNGLFGRIDRARLGDVALTVDPVVIPNLTEPELSMLVICERSNAGDLSRVLEQFPVEGWAAVLAATRWSGPLSFATEVVLPFRRMAEWHIDGEVGLDGVDVGLTAGGLALNGLAGNVIFDRGGILPGVLEADGGRGRVNLDLAADFNSPARLQLGAQLAPGDVLETGDGIGAVSQGTSGSAYWQLDLAAREAGGLKLALSSDLEGLGLDFPEPLAKEPGESWPLRLDMVLADDDVEATLQLADRIDARLASPWPDSALAVGMGIPRPDLPAAGRFDVRGRLAVLDLEPWTNLSGVIGRPDGTAMTGTAHLDLDRLHYGDLYVEGVELSVAREASAWQIDLAGDGAAGAVTIPVPLDSGRVLAVDMARLHLHDDSREVDDEVLELRAAAQQTSTASPVGRPPLHLLIEDLRYRSLELGRARIEAHSSRDGIEFEQVNVDGPDLRLQGLGRWISTPSGPVCEFEGRLITDSLSGLLGALGYESGIDAARSQVSVSGQWPGAPADFALLRLDGYLTIEIDDGVIPEARPGAGRLLGLVSVSTVPRRLLLDFRDVFGQGLKFDHIDGDFRLKDGVAVTENTRIDSPAARIRVRGSADMVERTYDQVLVVEPGVGATLPILGVLAAGPMGAAAGLVLQTLFERPLRGITEARYAVTGPWDSPVVDLVEARVEDEEGRQEVIVPESPEPD